MRMDFHDISRIGRMARGTIWNSGWRVISQIKRGGVWALVSCYILIENDYKSHFYHFSRFWILWFNKHFYYDKNFFSINVIRFQRRINVEYSLRLFWSSQKWYTNGAKTKSSYMSRLKATIRRKGKFYQDTTWPFDNPGKFMKCTPMSS